jgi:hypothetical protein
LLPSQLGGLFPDVVIRRLRDEVEFSWGEAAQAGAPDGFRFLHGQGATRVTPDAVAGPLFDKETVFRKWCFWMN